MTIEQRLECLERHAKRYRNALVLLVMSVCSVAKAAMQFNALMVVVISSLFMSSAWGFQVTGTISTKVRVVGPPYSRVIGVDGAVVRFTNEANPKQVFVGIADEEGRYRIDFSTPTVVANEVVATPSSFQLFQNYPNPFNPATLISYYLAEAGQTQISIYNSLGQRVLVLVDGWQQKGLHSVSWDGQDNVNRGVAAGVYFYRIVAGDFTVARKMVLVDGPAVSPRPIAVPGTPSRKTKQGQTYQVFVDRFDLIPFEQEGITLDGNAVLDFAVSKDLREGRVYLRAGRKQLFADLYVLDKIDGVERLQHSPRKYEGNPILTSEFPWESLYIQIRDAPLWNPEERRWEMRYWGRGIGVDGIGTFLAVSHDGLHWEKPIVGAFEFGGSKENNLLTPMSPYDLFLYHVLYDERDLDPQRRWKALIGDTNPRPAASADGINWTFLSQKRISAGEEGFLIYDELARQFVFTLRATVDSGFGRQRAVNISTSKDFVEWSDPVLMFAADARDQELGAAWLQRFAGDPAYRQPLINDPNQYNTQVYNMAAFPYEGIYLGMPTMFRNSGRSDEVPWGDGFSVPGLAVSPDLRQWQFALDEERPDFLPISPVGEGVFDTAQIEPPSRPIRVGDELFFYYTGLKFRSISAEGASAIHLARLRLDGFVSLRAGSELGTALTKPLVWRGSTLWINAAAADGEVRAEVLDLDGNRWRPGLTAEQAIPISEDAIRLQVRWQNEEDLSDLKGRSVRLRFLLRNADVYAFWTE